MIFKNESVLVVQDEQGNPVAFWRKHPKLRMDLMYLTKQVKMSDVEKFSSEMYLNNCAENLILRKKENLNEEEQNIKENTG